MDITLSLLLQGLVLVSSLDKAGSGGKLLGTVASIGHELELGLGPDLVELPGRSGRADNIIATLHRLKENMLDPQRTCHPLGKSSFSILNTDPCGFLVFFLPGQW